VAGRTIRVSAQWALEGKQPDGEGYRILACSTGDLDRANFADALSRFQLGELNTLPQVSVSYARLGTQPGMSYLALAIHWYAIDGQRLANGVSQRDNQGRLTAYTSYFCLPYRPLAREAIGYLAMYEALSSIRLDTADGPQQEVQVAGPLSRIPAAPDLAVRVAPLLLTGRPVCVLGAEGTGMAERLAFIDGVMELLPYGFRSRMTAATWTRASNRNHRFRLFFSSAARTDEPDHVVNWGDSPELVPAPAEAAGEYLDWLLEYSGPLAMLAGQTSEMGFGHKDTTQALNSVLTTSSQFESGSRTAPLEDIVEQTLRNCAEHAKLANATRLRTDIAALKKFAEDEISSDRRVRYRALITGLGLLQASFCVEGKSQERLYDALLRIAFEVPVTYRAYSQIEKCADVAPGDAPATELLTAILKVGTDGQLASAIVHWHLRTIDEKKHTRWLGSSEVDAVKLIKCLADKWEYPQHAKIVCDVTLEYLRRVPRKYQPQHVQQALCLHGFLARALQLRHPDDDQYQVHALYYFLRAAYPRPASTPGQDLSKAAIVQILSGAGTPPTPALLSAVLMLVTRPAACQLAWEAYVRGSVTQSRFDEPTLASLHDRLPLIEAAQDQAVAMLPE
jgi:hypothetical protein